MPDAVPVSALLTLERICFARPERDILRDVDLALYPGERVGLYGPNGCGKTTLFRLITGLIPTHSGRILLYGEPVRSEQDFCRLRRSVGFVLQNADDQLFCPTVLDDVAFGPLNLGLAPDKAREQAVQTLKAIGLVGFEERLTHRLSGGEKKLVSLACVLAMRPQLLLLDEPSNDLDPETQERIAGLLQTLPTALFVISHDRDFLNRITSRRLTVRNARLVNGE